MVQAVYVANVTAVFASEHGRTSSGRVQQLVQPCATSCAALGMEIKSKLWRPFVDYPLKRFTNMSYGSVGYFNLIIDPNFVLRKTINFTVTANNRSFNTSFA